MMKFLKTIRKKSIKLVKPFWNRIKLFIRWRCRRFLKPQNLNLSCSLIVSLTSFPPRFDKLHLTIKSLLTQSVKADRVLLWIAYDDKALIGKNVLELEKAGLEIRFCEDIKSFKKIIPTLEEFPDSVIVTADDDVYYWRDWLQELVDAYKNNPGKIIAHRLHRIKTDQFGRFYPYSKWEKKIKDSQRSPLNFATGIGGVLYPPGCFHPDVKKSDLFMTLCPRADDVWLYWMVVMNRGIEIFSGTSKKTINWPGTKESGLSITNKLENDKQIKAAFDYYGSPMEYFAKE